jgi:thiol-disulfide isomerase/thioredoxin
VAVLWILFANPYTQTVGHVRVGAALADFTLNDIHGKVVHLSDYSGRPVLINAWAIWCPPCKAEMPPLNRYYQSHVKDGFMLLSVNAGDSLQVTNLS